MAPLLIVNPAAGDGRARRLAPGLHDRLARFGSGARVVQTDAPGHARELTRQAESDGHDRVVAVGGDGTIQEVVNGMLDAGRRLSLGIVAGGNGNDLARSLRLPSGIDEALAIALGATTRIIDIGHATRGNGPTAIHRYFAAAGGIGFDAQVATAMAGRRRPWQRGRIGYAASTLWELRRFRNRAVTMTITTPLGDERLERRVLFVAFANGAYYGGGMRICPEATLDDGLLDLCIVGDISRLEAMRQLPGLYRGAHVGHPAVSFSRARAINIEADSATRLHLDGEPFGEVPVRIDVLPRAIEVAAPPSEPQP